MAVVLAATVAALMTACSGADSESGEDKTTESTTSSAEKTTSAAEDTTTVATTVANTDAPAVDVSNADMVKVYYDWDAGSDEDEYTVEIDCP